MKKTALNSALIIMASALLQFILIVYKHFIGYVVIKSLGHFAVMLALGTLMTAPMLALVLWLDARFIRRLDARMPWTGEIGKRVGLELAAAVSGGILAGILFTAISQLLFGYRQPLGEVYISNMLIGGVMNLVGITVIEALNFSARNRQAQLRAEILERENLNMRFEMLKKQLDPHFLFNSLNILSSLIRKDQKRSQEFIDAFAFVYRYTLDVIDKPVIKLAEEIEFAEAYLFLQKLRFEDGFQFDIAVNEAHRALLIPPLALQILLENAFKHNTASRKKPLRICIESLNGADALLVKNNIQPKSRLKKEHGIGLENLRNRYELVSERGPAVEITANQYNVTLPLIQSD